MENNKTYFLWADLIRIFAVFGVICIHTIDPNSSPINSIIVKISQTSVPLFVMLSGALLLGKKESYSVFFKKRGSKVLIPWLVWTIIYMIYLYFIAKDAYVFSTYFSSINLFSNWIRFFIVQFLTGLWFLPLIFSLYLITPALRVFLNKSRVKDISFLLILWFVVIIFVPSFLDSAMFPKWEPNLIYVMVQYLGFYILGFLINKNFNSSLLRSTPWYFVVLLIPIIYFMPISNFINIFTLFGSILIFIFFKKMSIYLDIKLNLEIKKIISIVSGAGLGIYLIHQLLINEINAMNFFFPIGILFSMVVYVLSLSVVLFIRRIPVLKFTLS